MADFPATSRATAFRVSPSLRHDVRNYLRTLIFDGVLQPGDRIVESRLARELGISQTPVREALRELEQMGMVVSSPNRGSSVRKIEPQDAEEMYTLRAHLEAMAIRLAISRMTDEDFDQLDRLIDGMIVAGENGDPNYFTELDTQFHAFICERSGHRLLLRTWESISPLNWTMMTVIRLKDRNLHDLAERHRPIVTALRSGDAKEAEAAILEHVLVLGTNVVQKLERTEESRKLQEEN